MKKKILTVGVVIGIVIAIVLTSDNKDKFDDLTFGVITGMSGDYAVVGEGFLNGVLLAQEEWNTENINDQIEIIVEDDEFQSTKGLSAYKKLANVNNIDGLINMTTFTIDVIYDDVVENNLPVAQGFEQGVPAKDDNVFQLWPGNVPAEAELGKYVKDSGFENIVVVYENSSSFFTQAVEGFKRGYEDSVKEFKVSSDPVDLRSTALKISEINPDAVVLIVQPEQGSILIKEIRKLSGEDVQLVFDANIQTGFETYSNLLGDMNILNGSILFTVPNNYRDEFTSSYIDKFDEEPGIGSETGYNSFKLLSTTYDSDNDNWIKNMKNASFIGADGEIVLDENGVRIPELEIRRIENGELPN